ncbi:MAG TPA: hypothetical protein VGR14_21450 [Verrucomicrobiae bacterium]|jgi:hypothetical protein|nr:hypothetical protein [Verrucomicrobiae bacterium]
MALTLQSWNSVVKKKYRTTGEFDKLDGAVRRYLLRVDDSTTSDLRQRWGAWTQKLATNGKTYQTSDRYIPGGALDSIAAIVAIAAPTSLDQAIAQRDAISIERPGEFVRSPSGRWTQKIYTQEEEYSCTQACACTFLRKLVGTSMKEDLFKDEFRKAAGNHDFSTSGTLWDNVVVALNKCGADAVHEQTSDWDTMKGKLRSATGDVPVLLGVEWTTKGGHAIMCKGPGTIRFSTSSTSFAGFLIEDPYSTHQEPGLLDDGTYWVRSGQSWSEGAAKPAWGCVVGKKSAKEFGKPISYTKGVKVM